MASHLQMPQALQHFRKQGIPPATFMTALPFRKSPSPPLSDDERFNNHKPVEAEERRSSAEEDTLTTTIEVQADTRTDDCKKLRDDIILAPFSYIKSLPSKGVRELLIEALNIWFQVPSTELKTIKNVVDYLHTSSLMFDDIEDNSILRRGRPATHIVFGTGQTINSATYILMLAVAEAQKLPSAKAASIVVEGVAEMLLGQSIDLSTTRLMQCPSEEDYLAMIDSKTGCLFQIACKLMRAESRSTEPADLTHLMNLLGRYFQIRDDYMNLMSEEYTGQKGFCEDLDEGKFSLPLIHCLTSDLLAASCGVTSQLELYNIFVARNQSPTHTITYEMKLRILEILRETGSLEFVRSVLIDMGNQIDEEVLRVERVHGKENNVLRKLTDKLKL